MELRGEITETKRSGSNQSTSRRVRMIFSVMASPNRIDILRILNSKGPVTYSELKFSAGFRSKKESGKFAYHLRKLLRQSLVSLNKSERRYTITNIGKLVLSLARQIEERSVIESGKMYVRTSHESIEEFNSHKIIQSLVREGNLPLELAQKITEEVENKIYKYQAAYMTGSLIREIVNSVLLEHGHEEYRNKLVRLGMPVYDVQSMIANPDQVNNGAEGILLDAGQRVFTENVLTNTLTKDMADAHLSGDLHISDLGVWSMLPDTIFVNIKDILENGVDLGRKYLDVSRIPPSKKLDDLANSLSVIISLLSKEASKEIVIDGLPQLFLKYSKDIDDLEQKLFGVFTSISTSKYNNQKTVISIHLSLNSNKKMIGMIINAYKKYTEITTLPKIGLIIDHTQGKITDVSSIISEIINMGGNVTFAKDRTSSYGIIGNSAKNAGPLLLILESVSINLPRLALESNKDETYFRARLALLMKPILSSLVIRKKDVSDLTRRGLNPILAKNTQYMQKSSISLMINLVGIEESVFDILGYTEKTGRGIINKIIDTAIDVAKKTALEIDDVATITMTTTEGSKRFTRLDGEKYGKNSTPNSMEGTSYSQGVTIETDKIDTLTPKSKIISDANSLYKRLNGGLLVTLNIDGQATNAEIKNVIEKAADLLPSFKPHKPIAICGECGFTSEPFVDKCPKCKSPYVI